MVLYKEYTYLFPFESYKNEQLILYNWYEKISRYLIEYSMYLFSIYIKTQNEDGIEVSKEMIYSHLHQFTEEHLKIKPLQLDEPFEVNRNFENNLFYNNKLIHIPNETIQKKIIYALLKSYISNPMVIESYSLESNMRNYYVYPTDFKNIPLHIILKSEKSYLSYLSHKESEHGYINVQPNRTKPYILYKRFTTFKGNRFIMQPISSLSHAIFVSKQWKLKGINLSNVSTEEDETDLKANYIIWLNDTDVKEDNKWCVCKEDSCVCDLPLISVIHDQDSDNVYIQVMLLLS